MASAASLRADVKNMEELVEQCVINDFAFVPTRNLMACSTTDMRISLWNIHSWGMVKMLPTVSQQLLLNWCDTSRRLLSTGSDRVVHVWDPVAGRRICYFDRHRSVVTGCAYSFTLEFT